MTASFILGALFLVCYVVYHLSNPPTRFEREGFVRYFYLFVLITHIVFFSSFAFGAKSDIFRLERAI